MTDRIKLNLPYHYLTIDGQPQVVLSGSIIDVPDAGGYPSASLVTKGVTTTVPVGSHAVSTQGTRVR